MRERIKYSIYLKRPMKKGEFKVSAELIMFLILGFVFILVILYVFFKALVK